MLKSFNIGLVLLLIGGVWILSSSRPVDEGVVNLKEKNWIDSVFNSMTPDQRLGQLFMVTAFSNKDEAHYKKIDKLVKDYNIGGIMYLQGGPYRQAMLTNRYQSQARVPLLVAMDVEWGLSMRLDSSMHFARQMTLGAMDDDKYVYLMGREIALQLKRMGVHVSFSPVLDVNVNPANPVIGNRSFGESKERVATRGVSYIKGLQDHGIIAVAKHFPGHGDTDVDSHKALPVIQHDITRLTEVELYPFKRSFDAGVMGVMVAHLYMPKLDTTRNRATTLSKTLVSGLLKDKMSYKGLVFTDALDMKGVSAYYKPGEVDVMALLAGNDVLLCSENVPVAITKIKEAIINEQISTEEVDLRIKKILKAKYWAGLNNYKPIEIPALKEEVDRPLGSVVQQTLYEHSVTMVANKGNLLPFKVLDTMSIASVTIGSPANNTFQQMMGNYASVNKYNITDRFAPDSVFSPLYEQLRTHDVVVVSLHGMNNTPLKDFGIGQGTRNFVAQLQQNPNQKVVVVVMGNPYSLKFFDNSDWLVCGYEDNTASQTVVPQVLFGALGAKGKLPVTASAKLKSGTGITTAPLNRLRYAKPEAVGLDSKVLTQIDNIALEAIAYAATPGCQVMVVKDGAVVFNKSYGHYTYDKTQEVTPNTMYDIASITKVAATLQAVMFLKDQGRLNLDEKASAYLPELKGTNKENMVIRDILTHQAGLQPFLPHWKRTIDSLKLSEVFYASSRNDKFPNEVLPGIYSIKAMEDSLWAWTLRSSLIAKKKGTTRYEFKYSDLSFYIMKRLVEKQLNQSLDEFMEQNFYGPLGLSTMTFNPLAKYPKERIAPTEVDQYFRKNLVWGSVHDPGAAMQGGVAGHAGLFSNANDLAILLQMNLQSGNYGGHKYFNTRVVQEFSKVQFKGNRRGLGWDKPDPEGDGPTSNLAPMSTFGHSGFTGTGAWVDPENKLIYIFLSNRVYPDAGNNKLVKYNIRTRIHDVIYQALKSKS